MRLNGMQWLQVAILAMLAGGAQAAYNCSLLAPPNYTQNYSNLSNSSTALSVTVSCTKTTNGTGLSIDFTVTPNNGMNASGTQNRANGTAGLINYDLYTDSSCTVPWSGAGNITFPGGGGTPITNTLVLNYFGCVPAAQPVIPSAGSSSDIVSMTLATSTIGAGIVGTNPRVFNVTINAIATCTLSTPGNVDFGTYTAFQPGVKTASSSFTTTCSNTTPYSLSLAPTPGVVSGVVSGLVYSLGLGTAPNVGQSNPLGGLSGTGLAQTYYVNGTMPANQAGTCAGASCPGSNPHTLTVTY